MYKFLTISSLLGLNFIAIPIFAFNLNAINNSNNRNLKSKGSNIAYHQTYEIDKKNKNKNQYKNKNLINSNLNKSNLRNLNITNSNLNRSSLIEADLTGSDLSYTK